MVEINMGLPEPPESEPSLPTNNLILSVESDTEDEDNVYEGYERLPVMPNDAISDNEDDNLEEDDISDEAQPNNLPPIDNVEDELVREVWSNPVVKDIEMDNEKVNQVKEAMLNFTLPASNIPEWANNIPEDQWKEHIFKHLQNK